MIQRDEVPQSSVPAYVGGRTRELPQLRPAFARRDAGRAVRARSHRDRDTKQRDLRRYRRQRSGTRARAAWRHSRNAARRAVLSVRSPTKVERVNVVRPSNADVATVETARTVGASKLPAPTSREDDAAQRVEEILRAEEAK